MGSSTCGTCDRDVEDPYCFCRMRAKDFVDNFIVKLHREYTAHLQDLGNTDLEKRYEADKLFLFTFLECADGSSEFNGRDIQSILYKNALFEFSNYIRDKADGKSPNNYQATHWATRYKMLCALIKYGGDFDYDTFSSVKRAIVAVEDFKGEFT